jgi:hypothetical protein
MAGPDCLPRCRTGLRPSPATLATLALLALAGGTACTPSLPPPQTPPKKPEPAAPAEPAVAEPQPQAAAPTRDATLIVIDPGDPDASSQPSLVEASKREKARKAQAGKSVVVINDETLPKLAKKGQLTFADLAKAKPGAEKPPADEIATIEQEQYWRGRARAIRQRWREAVDEGVDLERQAADLRRRFYAEADPFRRDGEIKPSWDRTLDRLRLAKERADGAKRELGEFLEEGRRASALPGWLREGAELEPEPPAPPKTTADAIEPPILNSKDEM